MKVTKVKPRGYCKGVVGAIQIAKKTREQYPNETIYILGMLVHNTYITNALEDMNIHSLEDTNKTRADLLDEIDEGIVIFTAHGTSSKVKQRAIDKGLIVVDASCSDVVHTQELVDEKLAEGYEVLYIGKVNHPEAESVCYEEPRVHLVTQVEEVKQYKDLDKIFVTNQTTMSLFDVFHIFEEIKKELPQAIFADEICNATRIRQEAVSELDANEIDTLLVVGDKKSNNSNRLVQIAKENGIQQVYLLHDLEDLRKVPLDRIASIAVTSGASTPTALTNAIIEYLEGYPNAPFPKVDATKILI